MVLRYALWAFQAHWLINHPGVMIAAVIVIALVLASRYLGLGRRD